MTTTSDTTAALAVISGKLGKSVTLLREQYATPGMSDADLIETIQDTLQLGHIYVAGDPDPLRAEDLAWLASHLFRVTDTGRLWRGARRVILPANDPTVRPLVAGTPARHGYIDYDPASTRRGDELSPEDQLAAVVDWLRPNAAWREHQYVRANG